MQIQEKLEQWIERHRIMGILLLCVLMVWVGNDRMEKNVSVSGNQIMSEPFIEKMCMEIRGKDDVLQCVWERKKPEIQELSFPSSPAS